MKGVPLPESMKTDSSKLCKSCGKGITFRYYDYFAKAYVIRCQGCPKKIVIPDDKTQPLSIEFQKASTLV